MQLKFTNFEVFSHTLSGYDLDFKQIDRGTFSSTLQQIECDSVFINRIETTRRIEATGTPPPGLITFGIPAENCQPFTWRNKTSSGNTIQIYKPDTVLEINTHPFFSAIDVSISEDACNILNQQWGLPELDKLIGIREMVVCCPKIMRQLRNTLQAICTTVDDSPDLLKHNINLQNLIKYEVPNLLMHALMTAETQAIKTAPEKRIYALKTATDYIRETPYDELSLNQFCSNNEINVRTLQRIFIEKYGVSPTFYAKAHHLNNVYKEFVHNDAKTTHIADTARNHGFWHMSQFATDYRRHFGELPSETLKNR